MIKQYPERYTKPQSAPVNILIAKLVLNFLLYIINRYKRLDVVAQNMFLLKLGIQKPV